MNKPLRPFAAIIALLLVPLSSPLQAKWAPPPGFQILKSTLSPDRTMAVVAPDHDHYLEDGPPQNKLVNVKTGEDLATLNAPTYFKDAEIVQNDVEPAACWSEDGFVFAWVLTGKWMPTACLFLALEDGAVAWQTDVLTLVGNKAVAKTKAALPKNCAAVKEHNKSYGSAYRDGFTVDIETPEAGFELPWTGTATLNSNDKDLTDDWPPAANVYATMDFTVAEDGTIEFSDFSVDKKKTGVPRGGDEPAADANPGGTGETSGGQSGFTTAEVNEDVRDWVKSFIALENKKDVEAIVNGYWSTVDYFGEGGVDADFIRSDRTAYIKKWPARKITLTGDISVKSRGDNTYWDVTYPTHIVLKSKSGESLVQDARNTLVVTLSGDTYAICAQHATVSNKSPATRSSADYPGSPAAVVAAYIEADGEGKALDSDSAGSVLRYTNWEDAPGWDSASVIESYDIGEVATTGNKASVRIKYNVLGQLSEFTYTQKPAEEQVVFNLKKADGLWKIGSPQLPPHLTVEGAVSFLKTAGDDPDGKAALKALLAVE